jgi:sortase A
MRFDGRPRRWLERALFALAFVSLGLFSVKHLEAWRFARAEGARLDARLGGGRDGTARRIAGPGRAWGRIDVPRVGVSALVVEGTDLDTLDVAVGHIRGTAFPGESGNVALAAHRDGLFRGLGGVRLDDVVRVTTPDGVFAYRVARLSVVDPNQVDVLRTDQDQLTLITCYPFVYVGRAPWRYIVQARPVAVS